MRRAKTPATTAPRRVTRTLNSAIGRLQFTLDGTEPWLIDGPGVGHEALGLIQAAAKMRKKHPDAATEAANRGRLLGLDVSRANELSQHILDYEAVGRSEPLARELGARASAYVANRLGSAA